MTSTETKQQEVTPEDCSDFEQSSAIAALQLVTPHSKLSADSGANSQLPLGHSTIPPFTACSEIRENTAIAISVINEADSVFGRFVIPLLNIKYFQTGNSSAFGRFVIPVLYAFILVQYRRI